MNQLNFKERIGHSYRRRYIPQLSFTDSLGSHNISEATKWIQKLLECSSPCMISRFGSTEMNCLMNYRKGHPLSFLRSRYPFWVQDYVKNEMYVNAGFFPINNNSLAKFADLLLDSAQRIDLLGSWLVQEQFIEEIKTAKKCILANLEPFFSPKPWTEVLSDKKILVIHPFERTIQQQYCRREFLFEDKRILPQFKSLQVIKSVQSIGGNTEGYKSWFDALHNMEQQIDCADFEIALIGCGAYGMPLAAHCKKIGKKAVHLGGALQLLFGIKGKRWESRPISQLYNEYWVRPSNEETPQESVNVENACYW